MTWTLLPGADPVTVVVISDCPACDSAGSTRRGVCDNCGARVAPGHRAGEVELISL
jgi:hypothetical protein